MLFYSESFRWKMYLAEYMTIKIFEKRPNYDGFSD